MSGSAGQRPPRVPAAVRRVDARVHRRVEDLPAPQAVDHALVRLSEAADHAKLWAAVALVLALTGRRRAAVRGVCSLLAASAGANLVGKRLVGGQRPPGSAIPARHVTDMPTSGSFPSGHSASAAAFTIGASLESSDAARALLPLGALVAYSRIHVGAHWLSDVLGGMLIGAVVALAGAVLVPVDRSRR